MMLGRREKLNEEEREKGAYEEEAESGRTAVQSRTKKWSWDKSNIHWFVPKYRGLSAPQKIDKVWHPSVPLWAAPKLSSGRVWLNDSEMISESNIRLEVICDIEEPVACGDYLLK